MNESSYGSATLVKAARAAAEAFLAVLDEAVGHGVSKVGDGEIGVTDSNMYDPSHDEPPFSPDPRPSATAPQQQMAWITTSALSVA